MMHWKMKAVEITIEALTEKYVYLMQPMIPENKFIA
jgi:hypothetical protein